jgi:hypothetical protein
MRVSRLLKESVYPGISPTDNHCRNGSGDRGSDGKTQVPLSPGRQRSRIERDFEDLKRLAGLQAHRLGTRASANTSGPDFTGSLRAIGPRTSEIANHLKIRTERRKPVSSAGPTFGGSKLPQMTIQPFDLMSRRHPLSSTRATLQICFAWEADRRKGSRDVPASNRRQSSEGELTSSSRPCGSSSQSSSLRSSPSLPS